MNNQSTYMQGSQYLVMQGSQYLVMTLLLGILV